MENTQKTIKRLGYYHSKDMDGSFSGAILKRKYPDIELRGWDYKDEVPDYSEMEDFDEVILIDITFPLETLLRYASDRIRFTVIDHHISFKRQVDEWATIKDKDEVVSYKALPFAYIFDDSLSACELGSRHYFGTISPVVELVGKYDTWRANGTDSWYSEVLPVKYFLYGKVNKPEDVKEEWFENTVNKMTPIVKNMIEIGSSIMEYEQKMDESKTRSYAFEREAYDGLKALCMNTNFFSSETMISKFDETKYDLMIGFAYNGTSWGVSLRSVKDGYDVSLIAKERGGGGHKGAAGFEVKNFEDIFK